MDEFDGKRILFGCLGVAVVVVGLVFVFDGWFTCAAGERVVLTRWGQIVGSYSEGPHMKLPVIERGTHINVQVAKYHTESEAASKDLQMVNTEVTLNYTPDPGHVEDIYRQLGLEWESRIVEPAIKEVFKAVTAKFTAEQLITERELVSHGVHDALSMKLAPYWMVVRDISLTQFKFSEEFNHAIEAKQTAEQLALKAQNDLVRVKMEAEQQVATAKGEAEALKVKGQQITEELLRLRWIERWDGKLPQYMANDKTMPLFQVK